MALITTSAGAREILERFRRSTGIRPNLWARAALAYSLSLQGDPPEAPPDSGGTEFHERTLFGDDGPVFMAFLRQRVGMPLPADKIGPLVKQHVERGLRYFSDHYERLNRRGDELILFVLQHCAPPTSPILVVPPIPSDKSLALSIRLGNNVATDQPVVQILNAPGVAPHVAVMGRNSTGKTRTALALLAGLATDAAHPVPFLIFDYAKGDVAANSDFLAHTKARVVSLPGQTIPLGPLAMPQVDEHSVALAAHRFRDTICAVVRALGPKQKSRCLDIIRDTYDQLADGAPDLADVADLARQRYADNTWPDDSLLACLREFTDFPLFHRAVEVPRHEFFDAPHIIDVHRLPEDLRKLAVFLTLDRLYADIMALPDAPLDTDANRQIRLIIVIDEAHHYLPCKQPTLEKMVREVRSKGVAVWLLSQSPDDFEQPQYNFTREIGLAVVFSCMVEKPKMLEALLGGKVNPKRLSQLPPGVALTRVQGSDAPVEVQVWRPQ